MDRSVVGAIAKPLVHAKADSRAIATALNAGLGVALPGEAWRNQLDVGHQKRSEAFQRLAFAQAGRLDTRKSWSASFVSDYAANHVDAQLSAGATLVTSAAHVHHAENGQGRANDLALADAAVDEFRARGAHHPLREDWAPRAIFASIMVQGAHLPDAVENLIDQYAAVEGDGYWIVVVNTRGTAKETRASAALAFGLEARTDRPAVVSCVGRPHPAFLAHGLAGVCAGHQRGAFTYPPIVWEKPDDDDEDFGIGVFTYHAQIRGATAFNKKGKKVLKALFERWPCPCGSHPRALPPRSNAEKQAHNQYWLEREAVELCLQPIADRAQILDGWLASGAEARRDLGIGNLHPGWRAVGHELDQRRAASDVDVVAPA